MTSRQESRDQRRASLLRGALAEFNERGFHGASTRSISRAAGVSSGLMFHYFPSKEAVYDELVAIGFADLEIDPEAAVAHPLAYLRGMTEHVLGLLRQSPEASAMFVFMARAERQQGASARADELFAEHDLMKVLVPCVEAGQRAGEIRPGDPRALALAWWSALQGLGEAVATQPDTPLPEADWLLGIITSPQEA